MKLHLLLPVMLLTSLVAQAAPTNLSGEFVYTQGGRSVPVWYFGAAGLPSTAPVVVVMHGAGRDGDRYLREWTPLALERHFLLVVPEFSRKEFPGDEGYILGNMFDAAGHAVPRDQWAFTMIEPIFDAVRARTGNVSPTYRIFGHSAGAQFVHRFLYFVPSARVARAVCANAGWYMLPDFTVRFPYGLKGTAATPAGLRGALGRPLLILLGTADTDPTMKNLRQTPEAEAQGPYRLARGKFFYARAKAAAAAMGAPFRWQLAFAPDVAHSDSGMAPFSLNWLLSDTN